VLDVLLALTAVLAIAAAVMAAAHRSPAVSLALSSLTVLVGLVTLVVFVVRLISPPELAIAGVTAPDDDVSTAAGLKIGLAATVATLAGAFLSMRDESFPRAARVDVPVETIPPPEGGRA
jgi:hypothetical protein